jgi:hypothetical protein
VDTKVSQKEFVQGITTVCRAGIKGFGTSKRMLNRGGPSNGKTRPYFDFNTTKILSRTSSRFYKRKKCNIDSKELYGMKEKFYRAEMLG